jgi:hypothetical protein
MIPALFALACFALFILALAGIGFLVEKDGDKIERKGP